MSDLVSKIIAYEEGEMSPNELVRFFAELVKTGLAWQLQGSIYGRPAEHLIEEGYISREGEVLRLPEPEPEPLDK